MNWPFLILAGVTLLSAIAAVSLRNLVHCALCLALTFAGLAALYLELNAQFVGFAQVLVYIGAVAILIVFAVLLTRSEVSTGERLWASGARVGLGVAGLVLACLVGATLASPSVHRAVVKAPEAPVKQIGAKLMTDYLVPLEVAGLLLTAAMIGAVIIAMQEKRR